MSKWNYGGYAKKYNMKGEIKAGTGIVKVHDIFKPLPEFMKQIDVLFSDPPCSLGNLSTFYTKNGMHNMNGYGEFTRRFFECVDEIKPKKLFLEVFKSNKESFLSKVKERYPHVFVYDSTYYRKNPCWIIQGSNDPNTYDIGGMDEEKVIEWICKNIDYDCIGDLCMGRGLVGIYSHIESKKFVGTELNQNRLAVLLERINRFDSGENWKKVK